MTTPYTTGTITLTNGSAVVTGVGTAWQTALIAGGTIFVDASGNSLPILSVDTNTQITAAVKWRGATGTYSYAIVRDTAYGEQTVANAQALATYLQRLDNASLSAIASLAPAADRLPYFTGAGAAALAPLTAFARTLLDDANGVAAYTTLGEIPDGQIPARLRAIGMGVTDANTALDDGFYSVGNNGTNFPPEVGSATRGGIVTLSQSATFKEQIWVQASTGRLWTRSMNGSTFGNWSRSVSYDNILGTVSQSAGLPTGALIERGSNANGEYVRFADGTQICTARVVQSGATDAASGSVFVGPQQTWTFPVGFPGGAPSVSIVRAGSSARWGTVVSANTTSAVVRVFSTVASASDLVTDTVAIGRWF